MDDRAGDPTSSSSDTDPNADGAMLDALEEIDWSSLRHAYGRASNVPQLLMALAIGNSDARAAAISGLWRTVWHQGTVYPATAPAVAFIANNAGDPALPDDDRWQLLWMLGEIAIARGNALSDPSLRQARAEVALVAPRLTAQLPAAGSIRWALVGLATAVPEASTNTLSVLRRLRDEESNAALRASLSLTIAMIDDDGFDDAVILDAASADERVLMFAPRPEGSTDMRWPSTVCRYLIESGLGEL